MTLRPLACACLGAALLLAGRAEAKCELTRMATLHVTVEQNQILIPGEINGQKVRFVFDTSFPASVITVPAARRLDLGVMDFGNLDRSPFLSAQFEGGVASADFRMDGYRVRSGTFAIFGARDNFGAPDIVGVLGSDYWRQFEVEIDLKAGTIQLMRAESCAPDVNLAYWSNQYNVVDTFPRKYQTVFMGRLNGHEMATVLDSGSPFSSLTRRAVLMYGPPIDQEVGADPWRPGVQPTDLLSLTQMTMGLGTSVLPSPDIAKDGYRDTPAAAVRRQTLANFGRLDLDEETIKPARFRITPTPVAPAEAGSRVPPNFFNYDAILGVDFLLAHHVLIANSQHKLYFSYTGGPFLQTVSK